MISRRSAMLTAFGLLIGAATQANARAKKVSALEQFDADHDGKVELAEAKKAASDLLDRLDTDKDGSVTIKELQGRLSRKEFAAANPDKDDSLTREEYLAVVEQRFKAADTDNDGSVGAAEFATPAGQALTRLLH